MIICRPGRRVKRAVGTADGEVVPELPAHLVLRRNARVRSERENRGVVGQRMHTAQHGPATWLTRWRRMRNSSRAQAQVAHWKAAWLRGADAVWHQQKGANPYVSEMQRAAWDAGAKWARENPDRRTNRAPRFAHPRRRAGDSKLPAMLKRAVGVSAATLTLYAMSKAFRR